MTEPSEQLIDQRVRNQIIWYLQSLADPEEQRECQLKVPHINVGHEMINQWEDWVHIDQIETYSEPVFSVEEQNAIRAYHTTWEEVAEATPDPLPHSIDEIINLSKWLSLMEAARTALAVFMKRGLFDMETEEKF